jgi:hypothetical protein
MKHRSLKLYPFNYRVRVGLKLFLASLVLYFAHNPLIGGILAALILMFPASFEFNRDYLKRFATGEGEEAEAALLAKIEKKMKTLVDKAAEGSINKEDLDKAVKKLNDEIGKLSNEALKELKDRADKMSESNDALQKELKETKDALIKQSEAIKKLQEAGASQEDIDKARKTFRQAIKEAVLEHKDTLLQEVNDRDGNRLSMKDYFTKLGHKQTPVITIKAPIDMLESGIVGANVANIRLTELDPTRVGIPLTIYPHVLDVFPVKSISKAYMSLLIVYSYEDGADTKVEGAASTKSSFLLKTQEFKAFFIATNFVLSDETLDDLNEALDEIAIVAPDKIQDKIDGKILRATGDDASDIMGIMNAAKSTAYASAFGAASTAGAYIVDVIADAKLQAENNKYRPNAVYLNPTEIAKLAAKKNTFEDSKSDKRVTYDVLGNAVAVCGLRILQSTSMAVNTALVLDLSQTMIGRRRDMTMEIGYNGTDLTEGQKTVVIKIRVAFGVRDKAAIIYVSDIAAAVAALTA